MKTAGTLSPTSQHSRPVAVKWRTEAMEDRGKDFTLSWNSTEKEGPSFSSLQILKFSVSRKSVI